MKHEILEVRDEEIDGVKVEVMEMRDEDIDAVEVIEVRGMR